MYLHEQKTTHWSLNQWKVSFIKFSKWDGDSIVEWRSNCCPSRSSLCSSQLHTILCAAWSSRSVFTCHWSRHLTGWTLDLLHDGFSSSGLFSFHPWTTQFFIKFFDGTWLLDLSILPQKRRNKGMIWHGASFSWFIIVRLTCHFCYPWCSWFRCISFSSSFSIEEISCRKRHLERFAYTVC